MRFKQLRNLICAGMLGSSILFCGVSEAGVVTDRLPLQCYADHQVNTYNSPGAAKRAGYISANVDLIKITQVRGDGWCYGSYPGAGGKRVSRWFRITDVCADAGYTNRSANVRGKQTVYRTRSGGATLGSVSNNEGVIVVADNGSRAQIVYRLDNGTGYKLGWVPSSSVQAPATVQQSHNPEGNFEGVSSPAANQIRVEGWAVDRDNMAESLRIHVYVGGPWNSGAESCEIVANKSRPDVKNYFARQGVQAGEFYGFNNLINVKRTGSQQIYVYAINVGGGGNIELGHKMVNIQSAQQSLVREQAGYIKTGGANLYFRQTPNGTILGKLSNGTSITVLQHPATNGWSKIRYNGKEGYIASQYISFEKPNIDVKQRLLNAVYGRSGGRISCDFDGYVNTKGRHEGIDMVLANGATVYSVISGVVTKVGGDRLNTVAIYDTERNKTVVYLHMNPIASLRVGQAITKGTVIGQQGSKGASSSHVHIEVRDGKRTAAAVSVNDSRLDNSNPYSYWNAVL